MEHLGKFTFGGKPVAGFHQPIANLALELIGDSLIDLGLVDSLDFDFGQRHGEATPGGPSGPIVGTPGAIQHPALATVKSYFCDFRRSKKGLGCQASWPIWPYFASRAM